MSDNYRNCLTMNSGSFFLFFFGKILIILCLFKQNVNIFVSYK